MGYSLEFVELTKSEKKHTFEIKDVSDKLGPGKHSSEVDFDFPITCDGFGTDSYSKTEEGRLICILNDGTKIEFLNLLYKFKPKDPWD